MTKKSKGKKKYDVAYLKAVEEIEKDRVNEIKAMVKGLLEAILAARKERKRADEKLAFLTEDLEDIRHGRVEKLKKRHEADKEAAKASPLKLPDLEKFQQDFQVPIAHAYLTKIDAVSTFANAATWVAGSTGSFSLTDGSVVTIGAPSQ